MEASCDRPQAKKEGSKVLLRNRRPSCVCLVPNFPRYRPAAVREMLLMLSICLAFGSTLYSHAIAAISETPCAMKQQRRWLIRQRLGLKYTDQIDWFKFLRAYRQDWTQFSTASFVPSSAFDQTSLRHSNIFAQISTTYG